MSISENIRTIQTRITTACYVINRNPAEVKVLLATKTIQPPLLIEALDSGMFLFGENRIQEALPKVQALDGRGVEWHFIGHLQSNKVADAIGFAQCIQSVDRPSIIKSLHKELEKSSKIMDIMIEVNVSGEASKSGCTPDGVEELCRQIDTSVLNVVGFMTIGANTDDEVIVRRGFAKLRRIQAQAIEKEWVRESATELSMGMSHDLEWAVQEGSTMVRVGSAVFGNRKI
ncbi:MAG: YggS family pyridoxal phosphate-dependent enzyme [Ignavibacteria bacterium]|nr:YggS family pyridoxal phosphate-dependent enzyme [Ignavibacteria bacterium]